METDKVTDQKCDECSDNDKLMDLHAGDPLPPLPFIDMSGSKLVGTVDVKTFKERMKHSEHNSVIQSGALTPEKAPNGKYPWEIDPTKLVLKNFIARGTYGTVHRGVYAGKDVAVKLLDWGEDDPSGRSELVELREAFIREVTLWSTLNHKNVTQFLGAVLGGSRGFKIPSSVTGADGVHLVEGHVCCLVLEFLPGGTLRKLLRDHHIKKLPFKLVIQYALDIAEGLAYLHSRHIVHRDVKSDNMLLDRHKVIKIADFGVSRVEKSSHCLSQVTGTYGYMAPEVLMGVPYDHKVDVYSFGILLWEIYCCSNPFPFAHFNVNDIKSFVNLGLRPDIPRCCPKSLANLMERCWHKDPEKRPDMSQVAVILRNIDPQSSQGMAPIDKEHCFDKANHRHVFHVAEFIHKLKH